ncbi:clavesin-1-like [Brevipalpus obovatus]|uniref:clavesin-1-like n=1 Tax=Brevipalpus obovatus TaxID=246614 RepID=UPI003D9EB2F8
MRASILFYACYQNASKHSVHVVVDTTNLTMSHLIAFGIRTARLQMELMTKVVPARIKRIHLVHTNRLIKIGLGLYWPFMPKKLRERLVIHSDLNELYQCCPPSSLPSFLGGTHEPINLDEFLSTIKNNKESVCKDWNQLIAAESKIFTENNNK